MGGQESKAREPYTCTAAGEEFYITTNGNINDQLWEFKNRCSGDPDRISEIRVGFADGFTD